MMALWARLSALGAVMLATLTLALPAFAEDEVAPPETPMGPDLAASIVDVEPSHLAPSRSLAVRVAATAGPVALTGVETSIAITIAPLADREAVDAFLAKPEASTSRIVGRGQPAEFLQGVPRAPGTLDPGASATSSILVDPASLALPRGSSGVYGVVTRTSANGVAPVIQGFVIAWLGDPVPSLDTAVLATVSGSPERVTALLTAASDPRLALAVDPTGLSAVDPELANISDREIYAIPSGHVDIASTIHAGAGPLLDFALARSAAYAGEDVPWVAVPATLDSAVVDDIVQRQAAFALLGSRFEGPMPASGSPLASVVSESGSSLTALVPDSRISRILAESAPTDATAPARIAAESMIFAQSRAAEAQDTPLVIAPGESWVVDGSQTSPEIAALLDAPWVRATTIAAVLAGAERVEVNASTHQQVMRDVAPETVISVQQTVTRLGDLAVATEQPSLILDGPSRDLLASMSLSARSHVQDRAAAIAAAQEQALAVLTSVSITSSSELTLVSNSGDVPITVRNDLESAVTVVVVMTSRSPRLIIDTQPVATIPAGAEQTVLVPITAVSSGDVSVAVALRSEQGATLTVAQTLQVRVRAEWGNIATGVGTAALIVLLGAGVWRTIRRGRSDTRTGPAPEESHVPAPNEPAR